jgi:hypothetical protein
MSRKLQEGLLTLEILESLHACGKMDMNLHLRQKRAKKLEGLFTRFHCIRFIKMSLQAFQVKVLLDRVSYSVILPNPLTGFRNTYCKGLPWEARNHDIGFCQI